MTYRKNGAFLGAVPGSLHRVLCTWDYTFTKIGLESRVYKIRMYPNDERATLFARPVCVGRRLS